MICIRDKRAKRYSLRSSRRVQMASQEYEKWHFSCILTVCVQLLEVSMHDRQHKIHFFSPHSAFFFVAAISTILFDEILCAYNSSFLFDIQCESVTNAKQTNDVSHTKIFSKGSRRIIYFLYFSRELLTSNAVESTFSQRNKLWCGIITRTAQRIHRCRWNRTRKNAFEREHRNLLINIIILRGDVSCVTFIPAKHRRRYIVVSLVWASSVESPIVEISSRIPRMSQPFLQILDRRPSCCCPENARDSCRDSRELIFILHNNL